MKWFAKLAIVLGLAVSTQTPAITVFYQPTPYPSSVMARVPATFMHFSEGWFNNSYNRLLVQDDKLQIGGWGDYYVSLLVAI